VIPHFSHFIFSQTSEFIYKISLAPIFLLSLLILQSLLPHSRSPISQPLSLLSLSSSFLVFSFFLFLPLSSAFFLLTSFLLLIFSLPPFVSTILIFSALISTLL